MKTKKYLIATSLSVIILAGATSLAFAKLDNYSNNGADIVNHSVKAQKILVHISPNGKALLQGTVDSISANSLMVKSWGGDWIVNISSDTKFIPTSGLGDIKTGDFVSVNGTVSQTSAWTIDANMVYDLTTIGK